MVIILLSSLIIISLINGYTRLSERESMRLEGTYQGENIRIQNFDQQSKTGFCIIEISVNGLHLKDLEKNNLEVDLSSMKTGQYVEIIIEYKTGCKPLVLNSHVLKTKSTMYFVTVRADAKSVKWTTNNETNQEPFVIEQHRYNKWAQIGKIVGKGPDGYNNYSFPVKHFSGTNKYRIKQRDTEVEWIYSDVTEYYNDRTPIQFYPHRADKMLYFSEYTYYEIFNKFGSLMKKGDAEEVNVSEFPPDMYYLNIDNRTERFLKK